MLEKVQPEQETNADQQSAKRTNTIQRKPSRAGHQPSYLSSEGGLGSSPIQPNGLGYASPYQTREGKLPPIQSGLTPISRQASGFTGTGSGTLEQSKAKMPVQTMQSGLTPHETREGQKGAVPTQLKSYWDTMSSEETTTELEKKEKEKKKLEEETDWESALTGYKGQLRQLLSADVTHDDSYGSWDELLDELENIDSEEVWEGYKIRNEETLKFISEQVGEIAEDY